MKDASKKKIPEIVDAVRSVLDAEGKKYFMTDVLSYKLKDIEKIMSGIGGPMVIDITGNADYAAVRAVYRRMIPTISRPS